MLVWESTTCGSQRDMGQDEDKQNAIAKQLANLAQKLEN
jgi:hypothetical protein